jgi:hypothetical protein
LKCISFLGSNNRICTLGILYDLPTAILDGKTDLERESVAGEQTDHKRDLQFTHLTNLSRFRPITIKEERVWCSIAHTDEEQLLRRLLEIDRLTVLEAKMRISPRDILEVPFFCLAEQLGRVFLCRVDENDSRSFYTRDELIVFQVRRVPVIALAPFPLNNVSTNNRESERVCQ